MSSFDNISPFGKPDKYWFHDKENNRKPQKGERYKIIHVDKAIAKMIDYVNSHKSEIENYSVVLETIKAVGILEKAVSHLKRDTLTEDVHNMTNIYIHGDNYSKVTDFGKVVIGFAAKLKDLYSRAITNKDRIRLFNYGLSEKACFEARLDALMCYDVNSQALIGKIHMEIMDLNLSQGNSRHDQVSIEDLTSHLEKNKFFENNKIDQDTFKDHPVVADLMDKGFIKSTKKQSTTEKINNALSEYEGIGLGRSAFKENLLTNTSFSQQEKDDIDKWIDEFIKINPEKERWI